jgi:exo-beta-1,3-glucanase (GH17 family)
MRILILLFSIALAVAANFVVWWFPNRPITVEGSRVEPPRSVSFSPYRRGQSPLTMSYPAPVEIESDMKLLAAYGVKSLRTYTSLEGMEIVPRLAGPLGLKVIHSAWLSGRPLANAQEVVALIDAANRYPDTITRIIVGNEVLLRNDLKIDELIAYIRSVKRAVKQPVSYADVWEKWIESPDLANEVDFITIHILPYWENDPIGIDRIRKHIFDVYNLVKARFPNKPILIGETGWPTDGRMRADARPGLVERVRFEAIFRQLAQENGFDYNVIEAFDQPWKSLLEGTIGESWGVFDSDRVAKFKSGETVSADPAWPVKFIASSIMAALLVTAFLISRKTLNGARILVFVLFAQAIASAFVFGLAVDLQRSVPLAGLAVDVLRGAAAKLFSAPGEAFDLIWRYSFYGARIVGTALWALLGALFAAYLLRGIGDSLAGHAPVPERVRRVRGSVARAAVHGLVRSFGRPVLALQMLFLIFSLLAVWHCWALILDGRYRDFPIGNFWLPAVLLLIWKLATLFNPSPHAPTAHRVSEALSFGRLFGLVGSEPTAAMPPGYSRVGPILTELLLIVGLLGGAIGVVASESGLNREAQLWAALAALMAVPYLATVRLSLALPLAERPPESFTGKW